MEIKQSFRDYFWSKVVKAEGCWEWKGGRASAGYGRIFFRGRTILAHRVSYILEKGEIAEGMVILHHCDNRNCVNPSHLSSGTTGDNSRDMISKGRGFWQKKTHCPQGHPYDEANTKYYGRARYCKQCIADKLAKGRATINPLVREI